MSLFVILRLNLIISADSLTNNTQQFPQIATNETVTTRNFNEQLISKLVVALTPNKAHL